MPTLASIGGHVDVLTSYVDPVVIVRRHRDREGPIEAVLQLTGGITFGGIGPNLDAAILPGSLVISVDTAPDAAGSRSTGPDNVGIGGIGNGPTALASTDTDPLIARNLSDKLTIAINAAVAGAAE